MANSYSIIFIVSCCLVPFARAFSVASPPAISVDNLSCSNDGGNVYQLQDVSYVLPRGAKVGLTGMNGSGKSTLLRILAESCCQEKIREEENLVYSGTVTTPRDVRVAFVEQEPPMPTDITVGDALLGVVSYDDGSSPDKKNLVFHTVRRYRIAINAANENPDEFALASTEMDSCNGWDVLTKAEEVATRLRVRHLQDKPLADLSGGERKRVALATALVQDPDVLLLDEPTNHLDLAAIQWLSDLILDVRKDLTILVVTHDRAFLEDVCDRILELDQGSLYQYEGSYAAYLKGKEERLALEDAALSSARAKYRVELEWMRRQPQARESKSKARIDAFHKLEKATKPRQGDPNLRIENDGQRRLGGKILTMKNVSLKFGEQVMLDDFSYEFCRGDKIGIAGMNGVGKSTFIRVLSGDQPIDAGEIDQGETVVLGVYDQMGLEIEDETQTVLDFVLEKIQARGGAEMSVAPNEARHLLNQFEFPRPRWQTRVSMLSGGEKRRLQLLSVLSKKPNFLVLDEPSNDIDLNTLTALETYLTDFNGVLLVVSHDRYFCDKVTNHLFVFEGNGQVLDYAGSLSEYADCLIENERTNDGSTVDNRGDSTSKKESYKESKEQRNARRNAIRSMKKEMNNIDSALEKLKPQVIEVQQEIDSSSAEGWTVLAELTKKLDALNLEIEEKELRWLELAEEFESAEAEELA